MAGWWTFGPFYIKGHLDYDQTSFVWLHMLCCKKVS